MVDKNIDGYTYQKSTDVTRFYIDKVLEGDVRKISKLSSLFNAVHMDRVVQGFIESYISQQRAAKPAEYIVGMYDMGQAVKAFLCNLDNISKEIAESGADLDDSELRDLLATGLSRNDLNFLGVNANG